MTSNERNRRVVSNASTILQKSNEGEICLRGMLYWTRGPVDLSKTRDTEEVDDLRLMYRRGGTRSHHGKLTFVGETGGEVLVF